MTTNLPISFLLLVATSFTTCITVPEQEDTKDERKKREKQEQVGKKKTSRHCQMVHTPHACNAR